MIGSTYQTESLLSIPGFICILYSYIHMFIYSFVHLYIHMIYHIIIWSYSINIHMHPRIHSISTPCCPGPCCLNQRSVFNRRPQMVILSLGEDVAPASRGRQIVRNFHVFPPKTLGKFPSLKIYTDFSRVVPTQIFYLKKVHRFGSSRNLGKMKTFLTSIFFNWVETTN